MTALGYGTNAIVVAEPGTKRVDFGRNRRCEMGADCLNAEEGRPGKVNRYRKPTRAFTPKGVRTLLLCNLCASAVEEAPSGMYGKRVATSNGPRPNARGVYLPGLDGALRANGWTCRDLAQAAKEHQKGLQRLRRLDARASREKAARLAAALQVPVSALIGKGR